MKVDTSDITKDKPFHHQGGFSQLQIATAASTHEAKNVSYDVRILPDPAGFAMKYRFQAQVSMECVRCGGPMTQDVSGEDWLALRTQHPDASHVVLSDSNMNVRFLPEPVFELDAFVIEMIDLALPEYPRHNPEADADCVVWGNKEEPQGGSEAGNSPFAGLSDLLKP